MNEEILKLLTGKKVQVSAGGYSMMVGTLGTSTGEDYTVTQNIAPGVDISVDFEPMAVASIKTDKEKDPHIYLTVKTVRSEISLREG